MCRLIVLALLLCAASVSAQNTYPPLVATTTFAGLGSTANNGTIRYCRDCDATDPCTGSGVGAFALRVNGAWQCAAGGGGGGSWDGGAFTAPALGPAGCTNPAYSFDGVPVAGLCLDGTTVRIQTAVPGNNRTFTSWTTSSVFSSVINGIGDSTFLALEDRSLQLTFPSGNVLDINDSGADFNVQPSYNSDPLTTCDSFTGDGVVWTDCHADADFSIIKRFGSGTADPAAACSTGTDFIRTDTSEMWFCVANVWVKQPKISATLTSGLPLIGGGTSLVSVGTRSGNTTQYVTTTGAQTSGDCVEIDADGNHIASGAACGGGSYDPTDLTVVVFKDEFSAATTTTGNVGDLGWILVQQGGAGTVASGGVSNSGTGKPGNIDLNSGTSDNGGPVLAAVNVANADIVGEEWDMSFIITPQAATTATYFSFGFTSGDPLSATSAIRAVYDTDHSHATWIFQICDSSTSGCQAAGDDTNSDTVASTKAPASGTAQRIRIRRCAGTICAGVGGNATIYMSVGDGGAMETEKSFCSSGCDEDLGNLPSSAMGVKMSVVARAAAAAKNVFIDKFVLALYGLSPY